MPPDSPDSVPTPPPPPPDSPSEPGATPPPSTTRPVPKGPSAFVWLAIGLIVGVLAGGYPGRSYKVYVKV